MRQLAKPKNLRRIKPRHCCATCEYSLYDGYFTCTRDPEDTTWDSGEVKREYTTVCDGYKQLTR
jgi:hypothetical protein